MSTEEFLLGLVRRSLEASVVVLFILGIQRLFRRQMSSHWRCVLWLLVVVRLLPFSVSSTVSVFNVLTFWTAADLPASVATSTYGAASPPSSSTAVLPWIGSWLSPRAPTSESPAAATDAAVLMKEWSIAQVLFCGWLAGCAVFVGYVGWTAISISSRVARQRRLDDPAALALWRECCARMSIRRAPVIVESDAVATPALLGAFRPKLLLPRGFTAKFSLAELRFVFLHELAHLRRRDIPLGWLVTALQILHWFNPVLWFAFSRWRTDREIACDALAVQTAGADENRAYGRTMLKLLENVSPGPPRPCLVGILEDKRQLQRRMIMIAGTQPAGRPFVAMGVIFIVALVGLTDAQVAAPATSDAVRPSSAVVDTPAAGAEGIATAEIPQPAGAFVLFLVNGSETMLTPLEAPVSARDVNARDYRERGRVFVAGAQNDPAAQSHVAPKWQLAALTLEQMLNALSAETNFHVAVFAGDNVEAIGGRANAVDRRAIANTLARMRRTVPRGAANLEAAFAVVSGRLKPERVVLVTDGLPTTSLTSPVTGEITEAHRVRAFEVAAKRLPPRLPVQTVLLPSQPGDPGAAGLFWELANATRGGLTTPARPGSEPRTHLAFVIDTSGSMRDPKTGGLWPIVISTIEAALESQPPLVGVQVLDGDGRFILGRRGSGVAGWLPNSAETRQEIKSALRNYDQDSVSNPVPGISNALRFLQDRNAPEMRMGIYLLGDEYNSRDPAGIALDRIDALNPRDASGRRPVIISAIGFPTTIRYKMSMGNTGLRFANLMRLLAYEHDGSFVALAEL